MTIQVRHVKISSHREVGAPGDVTQPIAAVACENYTRYPQQFRGCAFSEASMEIPAKVCAKCGVEKPVGEFHKHKCGKDGVRGQCKTCVLKSNRLYNAANPEKIREVNAAWRKANPEKGRQYKKNYRMANLEKERARGKAYLAVNLEKEQARKKAWVENNLEKRREIARAWVRANPEKIAANKHKRRARKLDAEGTHTAADVAKQFSLQGGKCYWCGVKLKKSGKGKFHVDHVIALARGGSNGPENIVCSCPSCNFAKNAKTPLEFAGRLF